MTTEKECEINDEMTTYYKGRGSKAREFAPHVVVYSEIAVRAAIVDALKSATPGGAG